MPLKPYHTVSEVQEIAFNPKKYAKIPNPYSAAVNYFKNYGGEVAIKIFENVVRDFYKNKTIKDEDLPVIAKKMYERAIFVDEEIRKKWISHLTQIKNARLGGGDPLKGYLLSLT